jgi:short-subunit dehydrogenase
MFLACAAIPYNGDMLAPDPYAFTAIYPKCHKDTIACVAIQAMYITKLAKEHFATRAGKSAIINITSVGGFMKILAYNPVYMATKRF